MTKLRQRYKRYAETGQVFPEGVAVSFVNQNGQAIIGIVRGFNPETKAYSVEFTDFPYLELLASVLTLAPIWMPNRKHKKRKHRRHRNA